MPQITMDNDTYLKYIWVNDIDDTDLLLLQKYADSCYYGETAGSVVDDIATLKLQLWKWKEGSVHFILLTELVEHKGGKELKIRWVGGKGYIRKLDQVYARLAQFARGQQCKWMSGMVDRRGFSRVYDIFRPLKEYHLWIKEL